MKRFKIFNFILILFVLFLCMCIVSAQDNTTQSFKDGAILDGVDDQHIIDDASDLQKTDTQIEVDDLVSYYKEKSNVVGYLKDNNGTPIKDKQLSICLNGKQYSRTTDYLGKFTLPLSLKPNTYKLSVKFLGDENFTSNGQNAVVKIKKAPLAIKMSNYNTYVDSDLFFKVKVYNKITGKSVEGIKVLFKVYSTKTKKYSYYYSTTDNNGVAALNKNLRIGTYKISTQIRDSKNKNYISYKNSKNKVTMKVKPTAETGCCSFYLQTSSTESVAGFRRDATNALTVYIKHVKWHGRTAIKQYKLSNSYFFHSITTSDGWMIGTGGIDNPSINRAIENLAGKMVKANKIKTSYLKKIKNYERRLGLGHFSIKAPNGKFAVVWLNGYHTGKLKPGEYISVPNLKSCYRHGTYAKFSNDLLKAAVKVGATDVFGVNRRDITLFHWKSTTDKNFKTTSLVKVYASNDNGRMVGRSTGYLKDNIYYKNKFVSKNKLPSSPKMKHLGTHKFGNIGKLVKIPTTIKAPAVTNEFNQTKYFKVTIKNKNTKKPVSNLKIKVKVYMHNKTKSYTLKTDKNGVAKLDTKDFLTGSYKVVLAPATNKYLISGKSTIKVKN
ncbi:hypothetical protein [Methanobrevibacter sp.]|uniref:hypothetical protein n=1 Tax=Methanobrevibacter sp. TaxID=66852 RepID=UPI00388E2AE2